MKTTESPNLSFNRASQWADLLQSIKTLRFWRTLAAMALGICLFAVAVNGLVVSQKLFAGGLTGISLIIFYLVPGSNLGTIYLLLNIPLFVLAWRKLTLKYIVFSVSGMLMASLALSLTKGVRLPVDDPLIGSITAGMMVGLGSGTYFKFGGSAGGLDILGAYLRKAYAIPLGTTFALFNFLVLLSALLINDYKSSFYSGIFILTNAWMVEKVISGFSQRNAVMIITDLPHRIAEAIIKRLDRGVTFLHGSGGYSGTEREIVYTVINMTETGRLKDIVYELDPDAFITILSTSAVIGKRFLTWEDEGYRPRSGHALEDVPMESLKKDLSP